MGGLIQQIGKLLVGKTKPSYMQQNTRAAARGSPFGEQYVQSVIPTKHVLAEEGSYFVVTTPVPGTAITYGSAGSQATFSDTVPFLQIANVGSASGSELDHNPTPTIWLDYLKIISTAVPATTTGLQAAIVLDNGARTATAGTPVIQPAKCSHMGLSLVPSVAAVTTFAGAVATIPASSQQSRIISRCQLQSGVITAGDEYTISAGVVDSVNSGTYGILVGTHMTRCPPFGIAAGQSATVHLWIPGATTSGFSYELEMGFWER